jgi:hypothetical protein
VPKDAPVAQVIKGDRALYGRVPELLKADNIRLQTPLSKTDCSRKNWTVIAAFADQSSGEISM